MLVIVDVFFAKFLMEEYHVINIKSIFDLFAWLRITKLSHIMNSRYRVMEWFV